MGARKDLSSVRAVVAIFLAAAACAVAVGLLTRTPLRPLPVVARLADFRLTDQQGTPFGTRELAGQVWIANFIFTRCPTVCPTFTRRMALVQARTADLAGRVRLVSFSVDPDYDTPQVLAAYARLFGADPARWRFLTGKNDDVMRTVVDGLKIAVERDPKATDPGSAILHGTHFVLVDRAQNIRGYFHASDDHELDELVASARRLLAE